MTHNNPLIQKYNELYNPKLPEPPKDPYSHLSHMDKRLIHQLEKLIEELKTGKASYSNYEVKENYNMAIPINFWNTSSIDPKAYMKVDRGRLISIDIFRRYD